MTEPQSEVEVVVRQTLVELMRDNLLADGAYALCSTQGWIDSACAHAAAAIEKAKHK